MKRRSGLLSGVVQVRGDVDDAIGDGLVKVAVDQYPSNDHGSRRAHEVFGVGVLEATPDETCCVKDGVGWVLRDIVLGRIANGHSELPIGAQDGVAPSGCTHGCATTVENRRALAAECAVVCSVDLVPLGRWWTADGGQQTANGKRQTATRRSW